MIRYCAIDTETTGLQPRHNDVIEVAVVVLDHHFNVDNNFTPFHTYMLPSRPDNIDINALKIQNMTEHGVDKPVTAKKFDQAMLYGLEPWRCADLFIEWFEKLRLPSKDRLTPVGYNYGFDIEFIKDWLGPLSYDYVFHYSYRDALRVVNYINDAYVYKGKAPPFHPSTRLTDVCLKLDLRLENAHSALDDAIATAQVYRRLMSYMEAI